MKNNQLKDKIQQEALNSWLDNDKRGTVQIITGLGKTFISLHALYTMPKDKIHLFLAETIERERDLMKDILKYNKIFNRNVLEDYDLRFFCYQSAYKWQNQEFGLVIADEIHDSLSPAYHQFYLNNKFDAIIGLSATIDKSIEYNNFTKGDLLDKIAPICYTYNINQGQVDGTSRKLNIYIINHELDNINKTIKAGNAKKPFFQSELQSYSYWDKEHKKAWYIDDKDLRELKITITSTKRSKLLYELPSKITIVKELIKVINGQTILFGNSINSLLKITPNVVSSRYSEDQNKAIRDSFESGKINLIGSFKMLKQGANLTELDNCVIMSYYGIEKDIIQRIGRLRDNGTTGSVFIIRTNGTQENIWFQKMIQNIVEFNVIECDNIQDCIKKYKINEKN